MNKQLEKILADLKEIREMNQKTADILKNLIETL